MSNLSVQTLDSDLPLSGGGLPLRVVLYRDRKLDKPAFRKKAFREQTDLREHEILKHPSFRSRLLREPLPRYDRRRPATGAKPPATRSEEHTSELQSLMRNSYAVFCLKKKKQQ